MRNINNIDIKDEANKYSIETSVENYKETRDAFIDGANFILEELQKEYTQKKVFIDDIGWVEALIKRKEFK